jgi:hypothetical protein
MKTWCISVLAAAMLVVLCCGAALAADVSDEAQAYLFSYFRGNGEDGLHLAYSFDGLKWTALKGNQSFLKPEIGGKLMRDPSIAQDPNGVFHMVWTTGWWEKGIGLAHSKDLITWSKQTFLPVMMHEPTAKNCWAPEIFYDPDTETFLICWATTIPGRFPDTETAEDDNNHRMYFVETKDFKTYSETKLFYDPGFNVIDTFIVKDAENNRYAMFLKNETKSPVAQKNLRVAFAEKAAGPYGPASEPITGNYWAEGPAALKLGEQWVVYFDKYTQGRYGAVASTDMKTWDDVSDQVQFPRGTRHGTCFEVSPSVLEKLMAVKAE